MNKLVITAFLVMSTVFAFAQNKHNISGKLIDGSNQQALPFASVIVLKTQANGEDILLKGVNTNEAGEFSIQNLPAENLKVKISFIGYQNFEKVLQLSAEETSLGIISLQPEPKMLKEVTVTATKNSASMGMDKRVFSVERNLTTVGGTAENLLRNLPSLTINPDGTANLRNMGATIYINGKPTQLSLAQIPAGQIESVEVISNPSAKYEAAASGGIVNLILKKNRQAGYNGTVSVGVGNNSRYDGMVNLNLNQGKWNMSALYNFNATQNPLNSYAYRTNFATDGSVTSYYNQNTNVSLNNLFHNIRLVADYNLDKANTLSLAGTYVKGEYNSQTNQQFQNLDANEQLLSYGGRNTQPHNTFNNIGLEFDWKHTFAQKGKSLSFISSFTRNNLSNAADWFTTSMTADGKNQTGFPETDVIAGNTVGNQILGQLDYVKPLNDSTKIELGLRSYTYIRDQKYLFSKLDEVSNSFILQKDYSQDANITETINAIYGMYSTKWKKNISFSAGLRFEQSSLTGVSNLDPNSNFGYKFPASNGDNLIKALFPSMSISKKINAESEIGLNFSRKVGRPNFRQLFVGIQANDKQNITIGNPKIQPEFVNTAELNYNTAFGKVNWLSSIYYIYEDNTIKPIVQASTTDPSVYITTFINAQADIQSGFDNTLTFSIGKKLNFLANLNVFNMVLKSADYEKAMWRYNSKLNISYKVTSSISAQLNMNYDSKAPQLQGYRSSIKAMDFAIRKSFMNNKASVLFTINDVFNSRKPITVYDQPSSFQESMNRREVRFYKLTLQLPIGNSTAVKKKDIRVNRPDVDFNN